jgi:perosamine synthetase
MVSAVRSAVGRGPTGLHEPDIGALEEEYTQNCLRSGYVSSVGEYVGLFEEELAEIVGSTSVIATVNGTSALHLGFMALDVGPGDEVLVPSMTFVATVNALTYCGGIPHFVDIEHESLGVDPAKLSGYLEEICVSRAGQTINRNTGRPIKALAVVHLLGLPAMIDELCEVAERFGIRVLEDAAGALGSRVEGRHVGTSGDVGVLSFNGNKTVTTGGGGALLTRDPDLAVKAKNLSNTWRIPHPYKVEHGGISYNYRMPNLNAALGLAQLQRLPEFLHKQNSLHLEYTRILDDGDSIHMVNGRPETQPNYWLQALSVSRAGSGFVRELLEALTGEGIQARMAWAPIHRMKAYSLAPRAGLEVTERMSAQLLCLPSSSQLAKSAA